MSYPNIINLNNLDTRYTKPADVSALIATQAAVDAGQYIPKWVANKAYSSGDLVISPAGKVMQAVASFTSGSTFNSANWTDTYQSSTVATDGTVSSVVRLTQAQYNALAVKVATTLYVVVG